MKIRKIRSALNSKGFERTEGSKHEIYSMRVDGRVAVSTVLSRGSSRRETGKKLISKMAKQLQMSNQQFIDYIDCAYTFEEYYHFIKENYVHE
ncbi:MAG: hypothetical protein AYK18_16985 [Theionarchaea archaeon DG-70]|nr:MAG: hypothetical protein AYK18_16985 [Theionarchaea archaeon DG-70]